MMRTIIFTALAACSLIACNNSDTVSAQTISVEDGPFTIEERGSFDEPWAMTFLPDGMLVITEKAGTMRFIDTASDTQRMGTITGLPEVDYGGQGGLGDVVAHPEFAENSLLYFSYVEAGDNDTRGAVVSRGTLNCGEADACTLDDIEVIWRQTPKVTGRGHYSHRIAFSPDGQHLFISSGDRQKMEPAQDISNTLGTVIRLNLDGSVPDDNPMAAGGGVTSQIWSYGHRNVLGLAFDPQGQLWDVEHGPAGGDELNRVEAGLNYGWPTVSDGEHYNGGPIPNHETQPELQGYAITWTPVIAPGGMTFVASDMFADWNGDLLIAGLSSEALVRVEIDGETAHEAGRYGLEARIREVEQAPDGAIWVLEDGEDGRLLRLTPNGG